MEHIASTETKLKCIEGSDGAKRWYFNDHLHRDDGPAIEYLSGAKEWYLDGKLHRVNGPAAEYSDGTKMWYINGKCHRADGPAIEWANGEKQWYLDGKYHRVGKPAIEWIDGTKVWYINGKYHRDDGPAIEYSDGTELWYLNGRNLKPSEHYSLLKIRKFHSKITIFNNALEFNLTKTLNSSRSKAVVEWYYSPDNGGGKIAKNRLENIINNIHYSRSN